MLYVVEVYLLLLGVHIPGKKKKKINFAFFEQCTFKGLETA
jgi:hypothetical protein